MSDEDINPVFPELEGIWVRRELCDELQAKLQELKIKNDTLESNLIEYGHRITSLGHKLDIAISENEIINHKLSIAIETLKKYANQDNWRPLIGQELGEHKVFIYSGCTPNILYAGMDAFEALKRLEVKDD